MESSCGFNFKYKEYIARLGGDITLLGKFHVILFLVFKAIILHICRQLFVLAGLMKY